MTAPSQEPRLRRLEDRFAIQDLAIRFMIAIDGNNYPALAEMFTEKALFGGVVGAEEVVGLLQSMRVDYGPSLHYPQAHSLEFVGDDSATGVVLAHAELSIKGTTVHTALRYLDEYERGDDGRWRFASRIIKVSYALPVSELAESMTADRPVRWPGAAPAHADPVTTKG